MTEAPPTVLFREPGASWLWLLLGPFIGGSLAFIQISSDLNFEPIVPASFCLIVTGFVAIQIKAARIHTSVELTPEYLRQGAETIRVEEIVKVFPPATGDVVPKWQSARALGELTGVPRGRTGVGLKLSGDRSAQAWSRRRHQHQFRATLTALVEERMP